MSTIPMSAFTQVPERKGTVAFTREENRDMFYRMFPDGSNSVRAETHKLNRRLLEAEAAEQSKNKGS